MDSMKVPLRPLEILLDPSMGVFSGEDSEPLKGANSNSVSDAEKVILDAIELEYSYRKKFRHKSLILIVFVLFASFYYALVYNQISIKNAYEMNTLIRGLLPTDYSGSFSNPISSIDSFYSWFNQSLIQTIWTDPSCSDGVCSAPLEMPIGIFPNQGCSDDCGNLEYVVFFVTLFNVTYQSISDPSSLWNMSMCWNAASVNYSDVILPSSSDGCIESTLTDVSSLSNSQVSLKIQFQLKQGPNVNWKIVIPFQGVNAFINMTIESRIVKIYGGPKGFNSYEDNSFATFWVWSNGSTSLITGKNFVDSDLCSKSNLQSSSTSWPFSSDIPDFDFSCSGDANSTRSFNVINPSRLYYQLQPENQRTLQSGNKRNTYVILGVHMLLFRKPYSDKTCGDVGLGYNETEGRFYKEYQHYKEWGPWCDNFKADGITPYGNDAAFLSSSSLYNSSLNASDYYSSNEMLDGIPYGFFDTTDKLPTEGISEPGFFILFDINLPLERAQYLLQYLIDGGFIDHNSKAMIIRVLTYNDILHTFLELKFYVTFFDSGGISIKQKSFFLQTKLSTLSKILLGFFIFLLALVLIFDILVFFDSLFPSWRQNKYFYNLTLFPSYTFSKPKHFIDYIRWNWPDLVSDLLFIASLIILLIFHNQTEDFNPSSKYRVYDNLNHGKARILKLNPNKLDNGKTPSEEMNGMFKKFGDILTLQLTYLYLTGASTLLLFVRAVKLCHFHPRLGIMTRLLSKIGPDMAAIAFIWLLMSIPYALIGMIAFGDRLKNFRSFWSAISTLFKFVLGQIDVYDSMVAISTTTIDQIPAHIYFWTYMTIAFIILLNFTIAVVVDMFSQLKEENNYKKENSNSWPSDLKLIFSPKKLYPMYLFYLILKDHNRQRLGRTSLAVLKRMMTWVNTRYKSWIKQDESSHLRMPRDASSSTNPDVEVKDHVSYDLTLFENEALVVEGREISNIILYDLIESRLRKILNKPVTDEKIKSVLSYVLTYYGVSKKK